MAEEITNELLEKYHIAPKEEYTSDREFYLALLSATNNEIFEIMEDYIDGDSKTALKAKWKSLLTLRKELRKLANE